MESNFALRLFWRCHQLSNGVNDRANFLVMFPNTLFLLGKLTGEFSIAFEGPT